MAKVGISSQQGGGGLTEYQLFFYKSITFALLMSRNVIKHKLEVISHQFMVLLDSHPNLKCQFFFDILSKKIPNFCPNPSIPP